MINLKNHLAFAMVVIFAIAACKKERTTPSPTSKTNVDVYVAGFDFINGTPIAVYWKNGVEHKVNDSLTYSFAKSIAIRGNDVYIAGDSYSPNGTPLATYWKNGVAINLSQQSYSHAIAIAVNESTVYVTGNIPIGNTDDRYMINWKNGVADTIDFGKTNSSVSAMAISGSDVYNVGESSLQGSGEQATYWKNGKISILSNLTYSNASAITINGSDIYIGGTIGANLNTTLTYWKNGTAYNVAQNGNIIVGSIVVNNNDIYIGGSTYNGGSDTTYTPVATYWKNGLATSLAKSSLTSYVFGMSINGTDIYAAGSVGQSPTNIKPQATYWKNGIAVKLSQNLSEGYAIAVVSR